VAWLSLKQFLHLILKLFGGILVFISHAKIRHLPMLDEELLKQALVIANLLQQAKVE